MKKRVRARLVWVEIFVVSTVMLSVIVNGGLRQVRAQSGGSLVPVEFTFANRTESTVLGYFELIPVGQTQVLQMVPIPPWPVPAITASVPAGTYDIRITMQSSPRTIAVVNGVAIAAPKATVSLSLPSVPMQFKLTGRALVNDIPAAGIFANFRNDSTAVTDAGGAFEIMAAAGSGSLTIRQNVVAPNGAAISNFHATPLTVNANISLAPVNFAIGNRTITVRSSSGALVTGRLQLSVPEQAGFYFFADHFVTDFKPVVLPLLGLPNVSWTFVIEGRGFSGLVDLSSSDITITINDATAPGPPPASSTAAPTTTAPPSTTTTPSATTPLATTPPATTPPATTPPATTPQSTTDLATGAAATQNPSGPAATGVVILVPPPSTTSPVPLTSVVNAAVGRAQIPSNATAQPAEATTTTTSFPRALARSSTTTTEATVPLSVGGRTDIFATSASIRESAGVAKVQFRLARRQSQQVAADVVVVDGSAVNGSDFDVSRSTRRVVIKPGAISATVRVPIRNDDVAESDEVFTVRLRSLVGARSAGVATVSIVDDDRRRAAT